MKQLLLLFFFLGSLFGESAMQNLPKLQLNPLTQEEAAVILHKATERPFSGKYYNFSKNGTYLCKQCNAPLFRSNNKFNSGCGWPSFDDAIPGAIKKVLDADGRRTEIVCAHCGAHLGHVFYGEGFTPKDTRYCVNSLSLNFEKSKTPHEAKAYFAGGCFWGVEYYLEKLPGVKSVISGYMGGEKPNPTYREVSRDNTGYMEVVAVTYNPQKISYETIARTFFEIHDPTQKNGQGPDIGERYKSAVFVSNERERKIIQKLIRELEKKGYKIATQIKEKKPFYKAESYHQDYYKRKGTQPYCHGYVKRF